MNGARRPSGARSKSCRIQRQGFIYHATINNSFVGSALIMNKFIPLLFISAGIFCSGLYADNGRNDSDWEREHFHPLTSIPQSPRATTVADWAEASYAFNRRTLVDAYKQHGSRGDAWDEQAIELLEEVARHFSSIDGYAGKYLNRNELVELAEPLINDGCDDPMVLYCYAALRGDEEQSKKTFNKIAPLLQKSRDGLIARGYPASRCYSAARRVWKHHSLSLIHIPSPRDS